LGDNQEVAVKPYHREEYGNSAGAASHAQPAGPILSPARFYAWKSLPAYEATPEQRALIAALNDEARAAMGIACMLAATPGFLRLAKADQLRVCELVQSYDAWTIGTDCYGEHDFGIIFQLSDGNWTTDTPAGEGWLGALFWKIDYFDPGFAGPGKRPWDRDLTARIITLMRPDEY
jgi:Protein of unknown function (DUF3768)